MALVRSKESFGDGTARFDPDPPVWLAEFSTGYWQNGVWHPGEYHLVRFDLYECGRGPFGGIRMRIGSPHRDMVSRATKAELIRDAFFLDEYAVRAATEVDECSVRDSFNIQNTEVMSNSPVIRSESEFRRYMAVHTGRLSSPPEFVTFDETAGRVFEWRFELRREGWVGNLLPGAYVRPPSSAGVPVFAGDWVVDYLNGYDRGTHGLGQGWAELPLVGMRSWHEMLVPLGKTRRKARR